MITRRAHEGGHGNKEGDYKGAIQTPFHCKNSSRLHQDRETPGRTHNMLGEKEEVNVTDVAEGSSKAGTSVKASSNVINYKLDPRRHARSLVLLPGYYS